MKSARALLAGLAGALAMSLVMAVLRFAGLNVDLEAVLGSLVRPDPGVSQWIIGFIIHLIKGAVIAWVYAVGFEFAMQRSGPWVGGGLGLCHGFMAGLIMSAIPEMNPFAHLSNAPGAYLVNVTHHMLLGPLIFILLHVLYGAVVGTIYGPTVQHEHALVNHPV